MASADTFKARLLADSRKFTNAYEDLMSKRAEWIANGGATFTDEVSVWDQPTEQEFNDLLYAIGMLEKFMTGDINTIDNNTYQNFFYKTAD